MDALNCQTAGYGMDFPFEQYERMTDYMRRCRWVAQAPPRAIYIQEKAREVMCHRC